VKTIRIPEKNWHTELAEAIKMSIDGDTLMVNSYEKKFLAERAVERANLKVNVFVQEHECECDYCKSAREPRRAEYDERDLRPPATSGISLYQYTKTVACETDLHNYCDGCICDCHKEKA